MNFDKPDLFSINSLVAETRIKKKVRKYKIYFNVLEKSIIW